MRYQASYNAALGETSIEITSNCYTDAFPLLRRIVFRKQDIDLQSQSLPLACAILTAQYCGEVFEFSGIKIGNDYSEAIREIIGPRTNVTSVDGHHRTISTGEVDILCEQAVAGDRSPSAARPQDGVSFARVDWSADFVSQTTRNSADHAFGAYQTNAAFFSDATRVSIAVGLLHGRDRCRNLYVRQGSKAAQPDLAALRQSLSAVSVSLELLN